MPCETGPATRAAANAYRRAAGPGRDRAEGWEILSWDARAGGTAAAAVDRRWAAIGHIRRARRRSPGAPAATVCPWTARMLWKIRWLASGSDMRCILTCRPAPGLGNSAP